MYSVIVRPLFTGQATYKVLFKVPGLQERYWTQEETLEDVYRVCRKCDAKILYISDCSLGSSSENLAIPDAENLELLWEPQISREEAKEIYSTQQRFCEWLCKSANPTIPRCLDELMECGILFGGKTFFVSSILKALEDGRPLEFQNHQGFKVIIPEDLATLYTGS